MSGKCRAEPGVPRLPMIVLSSATHASSSTRRFHSRPSRPPGASTLATSGTASAGSTQCQAWATSTTSTVPPASGIRSAVPPSTGTPGTARPSCSRIPADGSTAITSRPRSRSWRVSFPVPAPTSATRRACAGISQSIASSG